MGANEWAILSAMASAIVGLIVYVWNDSRKRDAADKAELREMLAHFSARVDAASADIGQRLQQQGERIAVVATQQLGTTQRLDGLQSDAHALEVSFVRIAEQVATIRGRLGLSSPSGGMPAIPPPVRR